MPPPKEGFVKTEESLSILQDSISYRFGQVKLLAAALTHSSHANEHGGEHNERLEFLGDAVIELTVSHELYRRFPDATEGALTKLRARLVSMPALASMARHLSLDGHLFLGKGEESQGGRERDSLLADSFEALLGAVFLDGGFDAARSVVATLFAKAWPGEVEPQKERDFKSRLQELTQRELRDRPVYRLLGSFGPEHEKLFDVEVALPDGRSVTARGQSVKKAEQSAARRALEMLGEEDA
jgi:ribonuclease-3